MKKFSNPEQKKPQAEVNKVMEDQTVTDKTKNSGKRQFMETVEQKNNQGINDFTIQASENEAKKPIINKSQKIDQKQAD